MKDSTKSVPLPSFIVDLTKTKGRKRSRCFWNVKPSGDYAVDCATGSRLALEYLAYWRSDSQLCC